MRGRLPWATSRTVIAVVGVLATPILILFLSQSLQIGGAPIVWLWLVFGGMMLLAALSSDRVREAAGPPAIVPSYPTRRDVVPRRGC